MHTPDRLTDNSHNLLEQHAVSQQTSDLQSPGIDGVLTSEASKKVNCGLP